MNMLKKALDALRRLLGLADPADARLTPAHGWLLPSTVDARRNVVDALGRRARRLAEREGRA